MALRAERAAGRRGARLGRAGFAGLACGLYLLAALLATWPAVKQADDAFLARADPSYGEPAAGDHLQLSYALWLVGHQLERLETPWRDPYSFRPEVEPVPNLQGWLFGLPYWPLELMLGVVGAWNALLLLTYVLAGALACAWLRALGLGRGAALVGGLAFALAPYRVAQSTGHLLGPAAALLPLTLLGFERGRRGSLPWLSLGGAALVAVPLSGQLHLALGAIPLALAYAVVRTHDHRALAGAAVAGAAAVAAGFAVQRAVIEGSVADEGRTLAEVAAFSARWSAFVARDVDALEEFVFLGWLTPLLALSGLAALVVTRRLALAALLAAGAAVPALLALGTNLPLYEPLWRALPPLRYPRVPERLMPIACLALAALAAYALDRVRGRVLLALALLLVAADLRLGVSLYRPATADERNAAYAALRGEPPGRLLELPVFIPERHYGSVYLLYGLQAPRERPGGYSSTAPRAADRTARALVPLNCGAWSPAIERRLRALGVVYVAVHGGLYADPAIPNCERAARRTLVRRGFRELASDGPVTVFART
ncbi:MAG: hypothetical protein ABR583_05390 [Gaiellaceae bacterium]